MIAHHWSARVKTDRIATVTTRAVVLEFGAAMSRVAYRSAGVTVLDALHADPTIEVVPLDDDTYRRTLAMYKARQDKEWSLTDCASFIVMNERAITDALSADAHFTQAGFKPLLSEP